MWAFFRCVTRTRGRSFSWHIDEEKFIYYYSTCECVCKVPFCALKLLLNFSLVFFSFFFVTRVCVSHRFTLIRNTQRACQSVKMGFMFYGTMCCVIRRLTSLSFILMFLKIIFKWQMLICYFLFWKKNKLSGFWRGFCVEDYVNKNEDVNQYCKCIAYGEYPTITFLWNFEHFPFDFWS